MLLEVHGASVVVGEKTIVDHVDFTVEESGVYVVVGPNGSGKTSFLSALAGRPGYRLVGGIARFKSVDLEKLGLLERARQGLVLGYQAPPRLKGLRLADLVGEMARVYSAREEMGWVEEKLGVQEFMDRSLDSLSGGERRRVEVYLVLLQNPTIALLDEPDSGVDVDWLDRLAEVVEWAVARKRVAIVLVSHTLGFLWRLAGMGVIRRVYLAWKGVITSVELEPREALALLRREGFRGLAGVLNRV